VCGIPYRVSAISLKAVNAEDIDGILQDKE
jgi:hypothetical protein